MLVEEANSKGKQVRKDKYNNTLGSNRHLGYLLINGQVEYKT
jgi:hypothetical protein